MNNILLDVALINGLIFGAAGFVLIINCVTHGSRDGSGHSDGIGPAGHGQFADAAQQINGALEHVLLELGEIPGAGPHSVVGSAPNQTGIGHDILFPEALVVHVHLVICMAALTAGANNAMNN